MNDDPDIKDISPEDIELDENTVVNRQSDEITPPEFPFNANVFINDEVKGQELIGEVTIDSSWNIKINNAKTHQEKFLKSTIASLNKREGVSVPDLPDSSAPRFTVSTRFVRKSDDDYYSALNEFLTKNYDLIIVHSS